LDDEIDAEYESDDVGEVVADAVLEGLYDCEFVVVLDSVIDLEAEQVSVAGGDDVGVGDTTKMGGEGDAVRVTEGVPETGGEQVGDSKSPAATCVTAEATNKNTNAI
jgi:hypothetical protein